MKRFIPPRKTTLTAVFAFLASTALSQVCNSTEYFIYENKETSTFLATRASHRCDGVACLYHSDCQSGYCIKRDLISTVDVEGLCIKKYSQITDCSLTYANITTKDKSNT